MIAEFGRAALIVGFVIAVLQSFLPLLGARRGDSRLMAFGDSAAGAQGVLVGLSFACLVVSFVNSDFSLAVVASNSHTEKPMLYKVAATWGNHEGSMLLWSLVLALFGAAIARNRGIPQSLRANVLSVQGMIGAGFLAFILFTSSPFDLISPAPLQGSGLNPLLEDPGLAFHPPFLYFGYVGFSTAFSFAAGALIEGRADADWARVARPWILAAWSLLTIGIAGGSLWAYYELGWGGWWGWDPVENASLMPWLLGTALLHCIVVVERRRAFVKWTLLLGIMTFAMSLVGTFIVRSGVLSSVHAFAQDPARGVFILGLLIAAIGGSFALFAWRSPRLEGGEPFDLVSRESGLLINNVLLVSALATVFIGTFYPLVMDIVGTDKISVGAPYFALTFVPLAVPLLVAMAFGPTLRWQSDGLASATKKLRHSLIVTCFAVLGALAVTKGSSLLGAAGLGLGVWVVSASVAIFLRRVRAGAIPIAASVRLAATLPRATYGVIVAHMGMGVLVIGVAGASAWDSEHVLAMRPGDSTVFVGHAIALRDVQQSAGAGYEAQRATFTLSRDLRGPLQPMTPELRYYPARQMQTTEAAILADILGNLYVSIGEPDGAGAWTVRLSYHPLISWIWLGALLMAAGGGLCLSRGGVLARLARTADKPSYSQPVSTAQ
jgi:cytochrome c-type biogenesis protein CcmF